jgi:AcrR family transcriptional regulator
MTIEGIAALAGVGKQTIYRWWPSKAAVVLEMWAPEIHPRIEFSNTGDVVRDIKDQLGAVIALAADPGFGPSFRALVAESQYDGTLARAMVDRVFAPRIEACKDRLRIAQASGELRDDIDLEVAVDLLYGGFYHRHLLRVGPLDPDWVDAMVDASLAGLAPRE